MERLRSSASSHQLQRPLRTVVLAIAIGYGIANVVWSISSWTLVDVNAYWQAAERIKHGQELYPAFASPNAPEVFRYAPWFAVAWIPLTYVPRALVDFAWSALLIGASVVALWPLLRTRRSEAVVLTGSIGSFLLLVASVGNVQPLMVASLVWGLDRRSGPIWVAIAASLKATPIVFVLVYVARREWKRAAAALLLTALLAAPMLLYDLSGYTLEAGETFGFMAVSPAAFLIVGAASVAWALLAAWRRSPSVVIAASTASVLCLPRVFPYLFTFLLVGGPRPDGSGIVGSARPHPPDAASRQ